jgi:hypothetical protein
MMRVCRKVRATVADGERLAAQDHEIAGERSHYLLQREHETGADEARDRAETGRVGEPHRHDDDRRQHSGSEARALPRPEHHPLIRFLARHQTRDADDEVTRGNHHGDDDDADEQTAGVIGVDSEKLDVEEAHAASSCNPGARRRRSCTSARCRLTPRAGKSRSSARRPAPSCITR